jgi:hypothetical protein
MALRIWVTGLSLNFSSPVKVGNTIGAFAAAGADDGAAAVQLQQLVWLTVYILPHPF